MVVETNEVLSQRQAGYPINLSRCHCGIVSKKDKLHKTYLGLQGCENVVETYKYIILLNRIIYSLEDNILLAYPDRPLVSS